MRRRWIANGDPFHRWVFPVVIIIVGAAVYAGSLDGAFQFDDQKHILRDPRIRSLPPLGDILTNHRPLVTLSLALNYAIGDEHVTGYHVFNITIHILVALALFGVVHRGLAHAAFDRIPASTRRWLAFITALIWVVHPLQTQSVTYLIQRAESMTGLFYLLTLYCVIRARRSDRPTWWHVCAVVACAFGMGCKAVMVTAPVVVLLYDRSFTSPSLRSLFRRYWGLYVGLGTTWIILGITGVVQVLNPNRVGSSVGLGFKGISPGDYALTQLGVIVHYLRLSLWPEPLCLDYGWPVAGSFLLIALPGLLVGCLVAATIATWWRNPRLGFVALFFFFVLAPTSSVVPIVDPLFEHRMYLPLASIVTLAVAGGYCILRRLEAERSNQSRTVRAGAAIVVTVGIVLLGTRTWARNDLYRHDVAMWRDVARKRPEHPRAFINLGDALSKRGHHDEAIAAFQSALRLDPVDANARCNLGVALLEMGRLGEAVEQLQSAIRINAAHANAYRNLGVALTRLGRPEEALRAYRSAIDNRPTFPEAFFNLGVQLEELGRVDEAVQAFETALRINPLFVDARLSLGDLLYRSGRLDEAGTYFQRTLERYPERTDVRIKLANILMRHGEYAAAEREYRVVLQLKPDEAGVHCNLAHALVAQGRVAEALQSLDTAVRIQPAFADAHFFRGELLAKQGRDGEAAAAYRTTLRINPNHVGARQAIAALTAGSAPASSKEP